MAAIGRRNVQEQNQETKARIFTLASTFEAEPLRFSWLIEVLHAKAMSPLHGILVEVSQVSEQDGDLYSGLWLTDQGKFFRFSALIPRNNAELHLEQWRDETAGIAVSAHQPGTGKSFGLLALEVLRERRETSKGVTSA